MQLNYLAPLVSFQDGSATVLESKLTLTFKMCQIYIQHHFSCR
jgi:hypothetical protein